MMVRVSSFELKKYTYMYMYIYYIHILRDRVCKVKHFDSYDQKILFQTGY